MGTGTVNSEVYQHTVRLLFDLLPDIAGEEAFALKGGTAINMFYRDMPRYSVDIDLIYLPRGSRGEDLAGIDAALDVIRGISGAPKSAPPGASDSRERRRGDPHHGQ